GSHHSSSELHALHDIGGIERPVCLNHVVDIARNDFRSDTGSRAGVFSVSWQAREVEDHDNGDDGRPDEIFSRHKFPPPATACLAPVASLRISPGYVESKVHVSLCIGIRGWSVPREYRRAGSRR